MFGNFIYFILALLIYATHQPEKEPNLGAAQTIILFLLLVLAYALFVWFRFFQLKMQASGTHAINLDHKFTGTLTQLSILAIATFAIEIYLLNLSAFLTDIPILAAIPTLQAALFIALFIGHLCIVWAAAYDFYVKLHHLDISRQSYIFSNISFAIPVLLPWFLLSGVSDIVFILPFDFPKQFLSTTHGEITYFLIFLLAVAVFGPVIIQKFWRCRPLVAGEARGRIESLCQETGVVFAEILYWPIFGGKMMTAGVMGLISRFRYLLVTEALIQWLEPHEVNAVIAHEIGHVKKKHLLFYLFFFMGYLLISFAAFDAIIYVIIYFEPLYHLFDNAGFQQSKMASALFSLFIISIFLFYFRFIFGFFMRNFERQADCYVYSVIESAQPLISTLNKIALMSGQPVDKPNWHHFSIKERIDYLLRCEENRGWVRLHDQKLKKGIVCYCIGILMIGVIGYQINFGESGERINARFFEKALNREIQKNPQSDQLYAALGDLYFRGERHEEAVSAYETALAIKPDNAFVLNNLAWLNATSKDPLFRDPDRAVSLARKALLYEKSPHIYDTLAEALFVNRQYAEAVAAGREALKRASKNRTYYEKQLKKFMKGLGDTQPGG